MDIKNPFSSDDTSEDILPSNVVSAELYNLLLVLVLGGVFVIWIIRICIVTFRLSELSIAVRNTSLIALLNNAQFERIGNYWGEGTIRTYLQALFRGRVKSPAVVVPRTLQSSYIHKSSIKIAKHADKYKIMFTFDASKPCTVELFWGVSDRAFNEKFLRKLFEYHEQQSNSEKPESSTKVSRKGKERLSSSVSTPVFESLTERKSLLDSEEIPSRSPNLLLLDDDFQDNQLLLARESEPIDFASCLFTSDFLKRSKPVSFESGNRQKFELSIEDCLSEEEVGELLITLPFLESSKNNNQSQGGEQEGSGSQEESADNDGEEKKVDIKVESSEDPFSRGTDRIIRIPLLILIKDISKTAPAAQDLYDDEGFVEYCVVYFTKGAAGATQVQLEPVTPISPISPLTPSAQTNYTAQAYKQFVQTRKNELLDIQEIYGSDGNQSHSSEEETECVICLSENRSITLLPCRHLCVCNTCYNQIDKCPICRKTVDSSVSAQAATTK